jgi:hypothetical protein
MQIVSINGQVFLVSDIKAAENAVTITGALEISSASRPLSRGEVGAYIKARNLEQLTGLTVQGAASYTTRQLSAEELITVDHQERVFKQAQSVAIPHLENETYDRVSG